MTQALDLVAREFTRPGDTVFVDDLAWYLMFGSFAVMGLHVVGIPRLAALDQLQRMIYLDGLSKTLAANLRLGFISTSGVVWADVGRDTLALAEQAMAEGLLPAPGCLFSPSQLPSTRTRLNPACFSEPAVVRFFDRAMTGSDAAGGAGRQA